MEIFVDMSATIAAVEGKLEDIGSERAVLSGLMQFSDTAYTDVADLLDVNTFTLECNQIIYKCVQHCMSRADGQLKLDVPTFYAAAKDVGLSTHFDEVEDKKYLHSLFKFPIDIGSVRKLALRLKKLELARKLQREIGLIYERIGNTVTGDEKISEIISIAEEPLFNFINCLIDSNDERCGSLGDGLDDYVGHITDNKDGNVGISSGMPIYDMAIGGGFRRNSVNVVGARAKIGKTTFGINVGLHAANILNIPVIYLDMEMSKTDFWVKILANYANVEISKIETGNLTSDELTRVNDAKDIIKKLPFTYANIAGQSFEDTLSLLKRTLVKQVGRMPDGRFKDCLVIYDYFRLNNSEYITNNIQEYQALGFQIITLKIFAQLMDIPILTFVQLNRDGITREDTDVISGSDRLVWLCTNVSIFKKRSEEEVAEDIASKRKVANRKLLPIATRYGAGLEIDGDYINMFMDGKYGRIKEGKLRSHKDSPADIKPEGFITDNHDHVF